LGLCWWETGAATATAADRHAASEKAPAGPTATSADDENPHLWKPKTRSVAVFKNGLGFFMREGKVRLRDGWCVAEHIPPALFGTLAIYACDEKQAVDIVGSGPGEVVEFDDRDAAKDLAVKRARLEASKFLRVELRYKQKGQERTAAGKLVSVGPDFVVLETDANSFAVPIEGITRLQILELPLRIHLAADQPENNDPARLATIGMAYLRKGITWIPDYTLKVLDAHTAELTLRGTLVNEAEDLIHSDVHFVVGVPHFVHTDYMAPISVGQVIRSIGAAVPSPNIPAQVTTQMMNRAAIVRNEAADFSHQAVERPVGDVDRDVRTVVGNLPQLDGPASTDYTVYTKSDLTLRRGEKAIITLFTRKIKYSHIYRWSPPKQMEHYLVLHNQTDTSWTTGPCLAISGNNPLSEDLLRYTPKGGNGEVPVTAAINIAHDKSEKEIDRKLKSHSPQPHLYYDLVTLEGALRFKNYEKNTVTVVINNAIPGRPTPADSGGVIAVDPTKLKLLEREGRITWTIKLEPGEEKTLTYQYERYVPSH
jgi:hypothetical protein